MLWLLVSGVLTFLQQSLSTLRQNVTTLRDLIRRLFLHQSLTVGRKVRTDGLCSAPELRVAAASFSCGSQGYLTVCPGTWVRVLFWQGPDEYAAGGWAYVRLEHDDSQQGWIPQCVLEATLAVPMTSDV